MYKYKEINKNKYYLYKKKIFFSLLLFLTLYSLLLHTFFPSRFSF